MRRSLLRFTHRLKRLCRALATLVLQSSTATTVTLIGFVSGVERLRVARGGDGRQAPLCTGWVVSTLGSSSIDLYTRQLSAWVPY